jgi:hypothetical protein
MVAASGTWLFGLQVIGLVWSCGVMCPVCGILLDWPVKQYPANGVTLQLCKKSPFLLVQY